MEKDLTKKRCLSDNGRYADLINGFIFKGQQVLRESDLTEMDAQTGVGRKIRRSSGKKPCQKYHDLIRKAAMGINFAIIGIENQEEVHYLMPLRSMGYDTAEYEKQAAWEKKKVRASKNLSRAEFLSGFRKDGRLHPCITLVLFFGERWDGGRELHDILDFTDIPPELKGYVNNYPIHLLEVRKLEDTGVFRTDLKQIFDFIRYSGDKEKLKKLIADDPAYQEMDEEAYDMAIAYANAEELISVKKFQGKEGKVNMCEGIAGLIEEGREEGKAELLIGNVESLMNRLHWDLQTACEGLGITVEEYQKAFLDVIYYIK